MGLAGKMAGLSTDPHLDKIFKSSSLKRAKPAQSLYNIIIDEDEFPGTQVGCGTIIFK